MKEEEIRKVLDEELSPLLAGHGGGIKLVEVTDDMVVRIKLSGGCVGCPGARMTISEVVEKALKQRIPEIKRVEAV